MEARDVRLAGAETGRLAARFTAPHGEALGGIVLVHGLRSDHREFADFPQRLAARGIATLALDLSGHGQSEGIRTLVTLDSHKADVDAALDWMAARGHAPCLVLGHSFGAHAALVAQSHPAAAGAVLVAPQSRSGGGLGPLRRVGFQVLAMAARMAPGIAAKLALPVTKNYAACFAEPAAVEWAAGVDWDPGRLSLGTLPYAAAMNNVAEAARTPKPMLVVIAEYDRKVPPAASERVAAAAAPALGRVLRLPGAGHSPFAEPKPAAILAQAVADFAIARRGNPGAGNC